MQSWGIDKYPSAYKEEQNNYFYNTNMCIAVYAHLNSTTPCKHHLETLSKTEMSYFKFSSLFKMEGEI